jgi:hypothetical protein
MNKFRELAGEKGYIVDDDVEEAIADDQGKEGDEGGSPDGGIQTVTTEELQEIPGGRPNLLQAFIGPNQDEKDAQYMDVDMASNRF